MANFIPSKDADRINWGLNFSDLITGDPTRYGLDAGAAALIQTNYDQFAAAYALAIAPETRSIVTVAEKDEQMAGFISIARSYAAIIRANGAVSDADKVALGLIVRDPTPTPVPVPSSTPTIAVPLSGVNQQFMTIRDQFTPDSKAKPSGVAGMALFRTITVAPSVDMSAAVFVGLFTRGDQLVDTTGLDKGKYANYRGCWYNGKGQIGPFGPVVSAVIV